MDSNGHPKSRSPFAMFDRLPPQNLEAEAGVIGSVMLDNSKLDGVVKTLPSPMLFYRDSHQIVWRIILGLYRDNLPVDGVSIGEELERRGQLKAVGGDFVIESFTASVPHAAHAEYYAGIVRQKATARNLVEIANDLIRDAYSNNFTADELLASAQARIFDLAEGRAENRLRPVCDILPGVMETIIRRGETRTFNGIGTPWPDLDFYTGGFQPEQLIVLAARPSVGKTAAALNIADHIAFELNKRVLFASLEMGSESLVERLLGSRGRVESHKIQSGYGLGQRELDALSIAGAAMAVPLFWIDDAPCQTVLQIMATARGLARRGGLDAVVVDYIQLVEPEDHRVSRQEQVAKISRRLKQLSRELRVPVIALSQLNRALENREDHRPRLADLKESGAIEQDADMVLFLHRPDYFDKDAEYVPIAETEFILAKNRNGATQTVRLGFDRACMRFVEMAFDIPPVRPDGADF